MTDKAASKCIWFLILSHDEDAYLLFLNINALKLINKQKSAFDKCILLCKLPHALQKDCGNDPMSMWTLTQEVCSGRADSSPVTGFASSLALIVCCQFAVAVIYHLKERLILAVSELSVLACGSNGDHGGAEGER